MRGGRGSTESNRDFRECGEKDGNGEVGGEIRQDMKIKGEKE